MKKLTFPFLNLKKKPAAPAAVETKKLKGNTQIAVWYKRSLNKKRLPKKFRKFLKIKK